MRYTNTQNSLINMQPFSLSRHCLANVLPDWCSTGPVIPGVVSDERTTTLTPNRLVRSHRVIPECRYCPNWLPPHPGVTRRLPAPTDRLFPNCSLCAFNHTGYAKICPGFHLTAVMLSRLSPYCCSIVRAFTVLLFYDYDTPPGIHMDLPNNPPNTIPPTFISIHTTRFTLQGESKNMSPLTKCDTIAPNLEINRHIDPEVNADMWYKNGIDRSRNARARSA